MTFLSDNRVDLAGVTVPTLVLQCSEDVIAPAAVGEFVHREIPGSDLQAARGDRPLPEPERAGGDDRGDQGLRLTRPSRAPRTSTRTRPCGYLSATPDGRIVRVNETFLRWTGYTRDELVGVKRFQDLLTAGGQIYHETHYAPLLRMQGSVREIAVDIVTAGRRAGCPALVNSVLLLDERRRAAGRAYDAVRRDRAQGLRAGAARRAQPRARRRASAPSACSASRPRWPGAADADGDRRRRRA